MCSLRCLWMQWSQETAGEEPANYGQQKKTAHLTCNLQYDQPKSKKADWNWKAKSTAESAAPGSPRAYENASTIPKITENVVCNPHFDPRKMDPLTKPRTNSITNQRPLPSQKKPPNSEPSTVTMPGDIKHANSLTNHGHGSSNCSSRSDSLESSSAPVKPHTGGDVRWDAINMISLRGPPIGLSNFRLLKRLGYGDIGSVYLVELRGTNTYFAMKVMDKASLASRNKLLRSQTEREILGLLDHPFLPTLYSYFETDKFYCLVMEFCSGGNLHSLRQKQPNKYFTEDAARLVTKQVLYCWFFKSTMISFFK